MRKTIKISALIEEVNRITSVMDDTLSPDNVVFRQGMQLFLENILLSTGTYRGFVYLSERDVPPNNLPGRYDDFESYHLHEADETRRRYIMP